MTDNLREIQERKKELELEIKLLQTKQKVDRILSDIRQFGFKNSNNPILTYEEILAEVSAGTSIHRHKGITFETFLDFDLERDSVTRKASVIKVEDWRIFDKYHDLISDYDFGQKHNYEYSQNFNNIPFFRDEDFQSFGAIGNLDILMRWSSDEKWVCRYTRTEPLFLERSIKDIKAQIDLIEKIGNQETDIRDSTLRGYSDYQLEYEIKKRKLLGYQPKSE